LGGLFIFGKADGIAAMQLHPFRRRYSGKLKLHEMKDFLFRCAEPALSSSRVEPKDLLNQSIDRMSHP